MLLKQHVLIVKYCKIPIIEGDCVCPAYVLYGVIDLPLAVQHICLGAQCVHAQLLKDT